MLASIEMIVYAQGKARLPTENNQILHFFCVLLKKWIIVKIAVVLHGILET